MPEALPPDLCKVVTHCWSYIQQQPSPLVWNCNLQLGNYTLGDKEQQHVTRSALLAALVHLLSALHSRHSNAHPFLEWTVLAFAVAACTSLLRPCSFRGAGLSLCRLQCWCRRIDGCLVGLFGPFCGAD